MKRHGQPASSSLSAAFAQAEAKLAQELGVTLVELPRAIKARDQALTQAKAKAQAAEAARRKAQSIRDKARNKARQAPQAKPVNDPQQPLHDARDQAHSMRYADYLQTEHWRITRLLLFRRVGKRCVQCAARQRLQVHHLHYRTLWHESQVDLRVLCDTCHQITHNLLEPPSPS
jgi:hypothetical protein